MINLRALAKTFTPSKADLGTMVGLTALFVILLLMGAAILAVGWCIWYGVGYLFGTAVANNLSIAAMGAIWAWWLIIEPLVDRYRRITQENNR